MNKQLKKEDFVFPEIYDIKSAQAAAYQGVSLCVLVIVASWIFALIFTAIGETPNYQPLIVMSILYGLIAMMIAKMSRLASIAGLIIYLIERIAIIVALGNATSVSISAGIIYSFALMFVNSIRGTFAYHEIRHNRRTNFSQEEDKAEYSLCPKCSFEQWSGYQFCQKCGHEF